MEDRDQAAPAPGPEELIGEYMVGFIGDPSTVLSEEKWSLYDALTEIDSILGDIVREAWAQRHASGQAVGSGNQGTTSFSHAGSSPGDPPAPS